MHALYLLWICNLGLESIDSHRGVMVVDEGMTCNKYAVCVYGCMSGISTCRCMSNCEKYEHDWVYIGVLV